MDIDLVITYVNGNDAEWVAKRNRFAMDNNNRECRFRDNGELKYLLRSVEKYAPWIHRIFLVMDSKLPDWIRTDNERLRIVRHEEIMPKEILPCYNSNVIEFHLDNIPDLSEVFIYANDDMFFGRKVSKDFFEKDGRPIIRLEKASKKSVDYYNRVIKNARDMMSRKYGEEYSLYPTHCIDAYSKEQMAKCKEVFASELSGFLKNRMRADNDVHRILFHYYCIHHNTCVLKEYVKPLSLPARVIALAKRIILPSKYLDCFATATDSFFEFRLMRLYYYRKPKMICINDSENTTERDIAKYKNLMEKKFKKKSFFEN